VAKVELATKFNCKGAEATKLATKSNCEGTAAKLTAESNCNGAAAELTAESNCNGAAAELTSAFCVTSSNKLGRQVPQLFKSGGIEIPPPGEFTPIH